jgi:hypothetical protein
VQNGDSEICVGADLGVTFYVLMIFVARQKLSMHQKSLPQLLTTTNELIPTLS